MKKEISLKDTLWYIAATTLAISAVVFIIGLFVSDNPIKFALGLYYGVAVSLLRLIMLARAVNTSVDMEADSSKKYMMGQYNIRMLMTIAALVLAAFIRDKLSIVALVMGLLIMQPAVYIANIIYEKKGGKKVEGISPKKIDRYS